MEFFHSSKLCEGRCKVDACNDKYVESCELFLIHIFNLYAYLLQIQQPYGVQIFVTGVSYKSSLAWSRHTTNTFVASTFF